MLMMVANIARETSSDKFQKDASLPQVAVIEMGKKAVVEAGILKPAACSFM
jgi:hypothetical protein